jgi:hypothetical protein
LSPDRLRLHQSILDRIQARREKIETLSGIARVVLITPRERFAADEYVRLKVPDSLRLETRNALGGLQMLLVSREGNGVLWIPGEARTYHFDSEPGTLKRHLGIALSVPELIQFLTGSPPVISVGPEQVRSEQLQEQTVLQLPEGRRNVQKIWINTSGEITRWERLNTSGTAAMRLTFEDFREVGSIAMPFRITYTGPDDTFLTIHYRSIYINDAIEDQFFDAPAFFQLGDR